MKKLLLIAFLPLLFTACSFSVDTSMPGPSATIDVPEVSEIIVDDIPVIDLEPIEPVLPAVDMASIELEIAELFVIKYNSTLANIDVNINDYDAAGFAKGMVALDGGGQGNEGNFLAALDNGVWVLVFDGNGFWDCTETMSYGFPETMTPDCYQN